MLRADDIRRLIASGESETVEIKSGIRDPDELARHIAALANREGGIILVGVDEQHRSIPGAELSRMVVLLRDALDRLRPEPQAGINSVSLDGESVVVIEVHRSNMPPVLMRGAAYVRAGAHTQAMSAADIRHQLARVQTPLDQQVERLSDAVASQTAQIEQLTAEIQRGSRWTSRLREWLIGGVIGAILGQIVSMLFSK